MIRIRKENGVNIVNIQAYDAVYLLNILDLEEIKGNLTEEDLEKLSSLNMYFSMGYKYFSLDFELDDRNYLYLIIITLIEKRALYTGTNLLKLFLQNCNRLLAETRRELLSYNQFSSDTETKKKVLELNYFINTLYYVSHIKKLIKTNSLEQLDKIGVTKKERELILNRSTE